MHTHTRALIAASAYAIIIGRKVAGIYDHAAGEQRQIAAECRGNRLMAADGERSVLFAGTLPELYDYGDRAYVSMVVEGTSAHGYDRATQSHYVVQVAGPMIQLYDYGASTWFTYQILFVESVGADGLPSFSAPMPENPME